VKRIDVHTHFQPDAVPQVLELMDQNGVDTVVNLSGGIPGGGLEQQLAAARAHPGRIVVFGTVNFLEARGDPGWGARLAQQLEQEHTLGAKGLKIFKQLGLAHADASGRLLQVDDPELDALFDTAGRLGMPVAIHTGDPRAFWEPVTPANERFDELSVHPGWANAGRKVPSFEELLGQFERRVAKSRGTTFIGVHFGNDAEDPERVFGWLDKYPNLYVDTSARVPEMGRFNAQRMHDLFESHADRILYGTDLGIGKTQQELWLGSRGRSGPSDSDVKRFFTSTTRYFETFDKQFDSPTPIQGNWRIDGIGLSAATLKKVYRENAMRVLGL
jgi:predicted TIM-barrel fold metal-dependent hydrolase